MPKTIVAYLQLIRLPNVVTAAADSLAGWILVTGSLRARLLASAFHGRASMLLYASGTMLNDVFDFAVDRDERPGRPLPSGRASRRTAAWLGAIGLALGPCLALVSGSSRSGLLAAALALTILGYDAGLKRTWLGPVVMGTCRGLNLLMGTSQAAALGGPMAWIAALAYGIFVAGITIASRSEAQGGGRISCSSPHRHPVEAGCILALHGERRLLERDSRMSPVRPPDHSPRGPVRHGPGRTCPGRMAAARAIEQPIPERIQKYIKTGILSLVWLHVGVVAAGTRA